MSTISTSKVVIRLEEVIGPNGRPRQLQSAIEIELVSHFGVPAIQAAEIAERKVPQVSAIIARNEEDSNKKGIVYPLTIIGTTSDSVMGSCFALLTDLPEIARIKKQRGKHVSVLEAMRALTFNEFEKFGAKVLQELGVTNPQVTPHGNDQGIDFYGEFTLGSLGGTPAPFLRLAHDVRIVFAGQAKHYPTRSIGPDIVRELVGAISLARTRTFSKAKLDLLENVNVKPISPLLAMLFTTGELSSGAVQLAAEAGLIARTGEQLAVFLADKSVGMIEVDGENRFDNNAFLIWLNS